MGCKVDWYTFCEKKRELIWKIEKSDGKNGYRRSNSMNGYWKNWAAASVNRDAKD